jgi:hypothetical protein
MTKRKDPKDLKKVGRKPKYKAAYAKQAGKLCLLGAIDTDLASFFNVSIATINTWKLEKPEFIKALKKNKEISDNKVVRSLFERATGYQHPDSHISNFQGEITVTPITKHYPPDTTAGIFWLKNRQPKEWRDKQDVNITGEAVTILIPAKFKDI